MGGFLHKDLSYEIIGICMEAHREYGNNHNERIYHNILGENFDLKNIRYKSKPKVSVYSKETGKEVGFYVPDYLVEDKVLLELKAKPFTHKKDEVQLSEYIKTTLYEVGYLINFGLPSLYFKRIIYTNDRKFNSVLNP